MGILAIYRCTVNPTLNVGQFTFANGWLTIESPYDLTAFQAALASADASVRLIVSQVPLPRPGTNLDNWTPDSDNPILIPGPRGVSAYMLAVASGFVGSVQQWLASLQSTIPGPQGASAYAIAVANGFVGTVQQWLDSLKSTVPGPAMPVTQTSTGTAQAGVAVALNGAGRLDKTVIAPDGVFISPGATVVDSQGLTARHWPTYPAIPPSPSDCAVLQVSQTATPDTIVDTQDWYLWGDHPKGHYLSFVKSRGNGVPGPGYYKRVLSGDRLLNFAFYGSNDANAAHAGYFSVVASADGLNNEVPAQISCTVSNSRIPHLTGWFINALGQIIFNGPNQEGPDDTTIDGGGGEPVNYGANVVIGAGASTPNGAPLKLTPGPLLNIPEPNAIELDNNGIYYATNGAGVRRALVTCPPFSIESAESGDKNGADFGTVTYIQGLDWVIATLTMGSAAVQLAAGQGLVNLYPSQSLPSSPCLSVTMDAKPSDSVFPVSGLVQGDFSRIGVCTAAAITLQANATYVFHIIVKM